MARAFENLDRHFVTQLATRIIELRPDGMRDFVGSYDEYLEREGDDHLDAAVVLSRARSEKSDKSGKRDKRERRRGAG